MSLIFGFIHKLARLVLIECLIDKGNFENSPKLLVSFGVAGLVGLFKNGTQSINTAAIHGFISLFYAFVGHFFN